jgi:hypothetical protein
MDGREMTLAPQRPQPTRRKQPALPLTACEFFAGIGLVRLALEKQKWKVLWANDIDETSATNTSSSATSTNSTPPPSPTPPSNGGKDLETALLAIHLLGYQTDLFDFRPSCARSPIRSRMPLATI